MLKLVVSLGNGDFADRPDRVLVTGADQHRLCHARHRTQIVLFWGLEYVALYVAHGMAEVV